MINVVRETGIAAAAIGVTAYATRRLDKMQLVDLAADLDRDKFGGWFALNGVSYSEIAAMWLTESSGNPRATNFVGGDGEQGGSWGLGQVTARTAGDYGILRPLAFTMLLPRIGARVSMEHIQFTIRGLASGGVIPATPSDWVQAYNTGVTGYLNGARNSAHLTRFISHLA